MLMNCAGDKDAPRRREGADHQPVQPLVFGLSRLGSTTGEAIAANENLRSGVATRSSAHADGRSLPVVDPPTMKHRHLSLTTPSSDVASRSSYRVLVRTGAD